METATQPRQYKQSCGGIWQNTSKNGNEYLTLTINNKRYVAFRNTLKQPGEKTPDWRVQEQEDRPQQQPAQVAQKPPPLNPNQGQGIKPPVAKTQWQNQRQEQMRPEKNWAEEPYPDEPQF